MEEDYSDFIIAENEVVEETTEEVANPQDKEVQTETEVTAESTEKVEQTEEVKEETTETKEPTETQRVSQRINEARQQARDELIANMGYEWNGQPIVTERQYNEAVAEQREQQRRAELEEKGIDPRIMDDAIANNPIVKQAQQLIENQRIEQARQKNFNDFLDEYPNVKPDEIPNQVWEEVNNGRSLVDAYSRYELKTLREKVKTLEQNNQNKQKAPINSGIATHGSDEVASEDDFMRGFNSVK